MGRIKGWSDFVTGLVSLPVIAFLANETRNFQVVDWVPLGLAFWPRVLLAIWFVLSLFLIVRGLRHPSNGGELNLVAFLPVGLGLVFLIAVPVLGMLGPLWVLVAGFGFLRRDTHDRRGAIMSIVAASVVTLVIYLLFSTVLGVDLPGFDFGE